MKLTIACIALLASVGVAHAQSVAGSAANARNKNVNAAGSIAAGNTVNNYSGVPNTSQRVTYGGSYDIRNVPSVSAPGIITAHNCSMGVSAGGSGMGWGISLGGTYVDEACQLVGQAAALNTLVGADVAVRHLARDPAMCATLMAAGAVTGQCPGTNARVRNVPTTSTRNVATTEASSIRQYGLLKCEKDGDRVRIKYRAGVDKAVAKANCLTVLGY